MKRKILLSIISIFSVSFTTSCKDTTTNNIVAQIECPSGYETINDDITINSILNVDYSYNLKTPGKELSYNYLWDGYDMSNKFGPSLTEDERLYTYLTEYKEFDNQFCLVYLKKNLIASYFDYLKTYESEKADYNFSKYDAEKIIDGKYLYCFKKNTKNVENNLFFFKVNDISKIKYQIDDFQLVMCLASKKATILENISNNQTINHDINLFHRYVLKFEDNNDIPSYYDLNVYNQNIDDNMFSYVGKMLEAFPLSYENISYSYFPKIGLDNLFRCKYKRVKVVEEEKSEYLLLPRYQVSGDNKVDILDENTSFTTDEDIYGTHKKEFLDAFILEKDITESNYIMALFDYEKVKNIIKN